MKRLKQCRDWVLQHPWETACIVLGVGLVAQTINAGKIAKVANFQGNEIDRANRNQELIVEALRNGWTLILNEDNRTIDILDFDEASQALQAV